MKSSFHRIGFDIGATKISCCVLSPNDDYIFRSLPTPTPKENYNSFLLALKRLLDDARASTPFANEATIGVGIPGEMDIETNTVKNASSIWLIGKALQEDLESVFHQDVRIANDGHCLIASEVEDGAAQGATVAFGVILGTGVGGGVAINGSAWRGKNRLAGEWGHNAFPNRTNDAEPLNHYCGRSHCIESVLSGPAFSMAYKNATGDDKMPTEIAELAAKNHAPALKVLDQYVDRLAEALSTIVNAFDPEVIVLGGSLSNIDQLYSLLPERIAKFVYHISTSKRRITTSIVKSKWGPDSGVRGAARLWPLPKEAKR